jgi:peptide/nickel transport system permease protein
MTATPLAEPGLEPRRPAVVRFWRSNPLITTAVVMIAVVAVIAALANLIAPFPNDAASATHPRIALQAPSAVHWFGTDQTGRDVFSRILFGARISPLIALIVIASSCLIGVFLGAVAGYIGGFVDEVVMRVTDVFLAVPPLLLALAFSVVLPPTLTSTTIAITISWWPWYARLVRGEVRAVSRRRYVDSARVLGLPHRHILARHVLPNSVTPLIVQSSLDFGGVILTASALSFLGLGSQDPTPDWGLMVAQGEAFFQTQWWLVTFPGLAILFTAMAFNLLGDGLRERFDPRRVRLR